MEKLASISFLRRHPIEFSAKKMASHLILIAGALVMIFPLIWLISSSFKPSNMIFTNKIQIIPEVFTLDNFIKGWNTNSQYPFHHFILNTLMLVTKVLLGTLLSCSLTAYAFAKLNFPLKKVWFTILICTMMVPAQVTLIPSYIIFTKLGFLNSHLPFVIPAFLATNAFYVFLLIQFMKGIPDELCQAAKIDGCSKFRIYWNIMLPLSKTAMFSVAIFSFMGTWNDFLLPLIYLTSVKNYTVSIILKSVVDVTAAQSWGSLMALSLVAIAPCVLIFFAAQKYFIEGIATTGLKG